jgi:hypothetical protein
MNIYNRNQYNNVIEIQLAIKNQSKLGWKLLTSCNKKSREQKTTKKKKSKNDKKKKQTL